MSYEDAPLAPEPPVGDSGQKTAAKAAQILTELDPSFIIPTRSQKDEFVVAMARRRKVLYGRAYDIIRLPKDESLDGPDAPERLADKVMFYEIKSTRKPVGPAFEGYFFSLSTAELLVAQSLGPQFRFAFVNTSTRTYLDLSLNQLFGKARAVYPTWSIMF